MARGRDRVAAMRPLNDAMRDQVEAERQRANFAFTDDQLRRGKGTDRDIAILRGRDQYGHEWDVANRYADGWYAAHIGWPHSYPDGIPSQASLASRRAAYDQGFIDGGGDRTDLFDAARRSNLAHLRQSSCPPPPPSSTLTGRPLPSAWPKPSDEPRPTRWSRRLAILSEDDARTDAPANDLWDFLRLIQQRPGADAATVLVHTPDGFVLAGNRPAQRDGNAPVDGSAGYRQLVDALAGREFDDILVALQGEALALLDTIAGALPLCRTMERTRNTRLQQRAHLRIWLDRGYGAKVNMAAGHIRWSKAINGLSGKLGEFTARYIGPAPDRGHLIRVETASGAPATGYATVAGSPLTPEIIVSSKARVRAAIGTTLRAFAASTPLMGTLALRTASPRRPDKQCTAECALAGPTKLKGRGSEHGRTADPANSTQEQPMRNILAANDADLEYGDAERGGW